MAILPTWSRPCAAPTSPRRSLALLKGVTPPGVQRTVSVAFGKGEVQSYTGELSIDGEPRDCEATLIPRAEDDLASIAGVSIHESSAETPEGNTSGQRVAPKVTGTGGMSSETVPRRLKRFFDTGQPGEGTVLELFVCSRIAEQNGGHMLVYDLACIVSAIEA